jgi:tetratricopeptide (TPR) repeat protein
VILTACAVTPPPADLVRAERLSGWSESADAEGAYRAAVQKTCDEHPARHADAHMRDRWCGASLRGLAEELAREGKRDEALATYLRVLTALPDSPEDQVEAMLRAASLELEDGGDPKLAYDLLWRAILTFPDADDTADALRTLFADGRRRAPRQLYDVFIALYPVLGATPLGDRLVWDLGRLAREDLGDALRAEEIDDELADRYPTSSLRDDALFEAAALARARGDGKEAARRLRELLATRETAMFVGSYITPHLPDAQLELGRVLRDDLHDPRAALDAFARVEKDYPKSRELDDALFELAATQAQLGDRRAACNTLAVLRNRFPECRYEVSDAPALEEKLACGR